MERKILLDKEDRSYILNWMHQNKVYDYYHQFTGGSVVVKKIRDYNTMAWCVIVSVLFGVFFGQHIFKELMSLHPAPLTIVLTAIGFMYLIYIMYILTEIFVLGVKGQKRVTIRQESMRYREE